GAAQRQREARARLRRDRLRFDERHERLERLQVVIERELDHRRRRLLAELLRREGLPVQLFQDRAHERLVIGAEALRQQRRQLVRRHRRALLPERRKTLLCERLTRLPVFSEESAARAHRAQLVDRVDGGRRVAQEEIEVVRQVPQRRVEIVENLFVVQERRGDVEHGLAIVRFEL